MIVTNGQSTTADHGLFHCKNIGVLAIIINYYLHSRLLKAPCSAIIYAPHSVP